MAKSLCRAPKKNGQPPDGMASAHLIPDPDSPPGHRVFSWEIDPLIDGPGPVSFGVGEAILVTVAFSCSSDPLQDTFIAVSLESWYPAEKGVGRELFWRMCSHSIKNVKGDL
jgi:hypothetical protein